MKIDHSFCKRISGLDTLEALGEDVQVVTVPTTGKTLVVTQRVDLDLEDADGVARELAFADNRIGELNLAWDAQQIAQALEDNLDLAAFFHQHEIETLLTGVEGEDGATKAEKDDRDPVPEMELQPFEHFDYVAIFFRSTWDWARAVDLLGIGERALAHCALHPTRGGSVVQNRRYAGYTLRSIRL